MLVLTGAIFKNKQEPNGLATGFTPATKLLVKKRMWTVFEFQ
jgi:hypothetical protein